jgi:hypothetical protein
MGIQNYFFKLIPAGVAPVKGEKNEYVLTGESRLSEEELESSLTKLSIPMKSYSNGWRKGLIVDGHLLVLPTIREGKVQEILVEGALTWFPEGLNDAFQIANCLGEVELFLPGIGFKRYLPSESERFIADMSEIYVEKKKRFSEAFPNRYGKFDPESAAIFRPSGSTWLRKITALFGFSSGKAR